MPSFGSFDAVRLSLASPEQIRSWSHGEVTKAETINYRTLKPERDGLFCEKIFGPAKDYECHCGRYKKMRYKGVICEKCGVEVAPSSVRRERMGHLELAAPVAHIWFTKLVPSPLSILLDISPRNLEGVIYFARHIINSVDEEGRKKMLKQLDKDKTRKIAEQRRRRNRQIKKLEAGAKSGKKTENPVKKIDQLQAEFAEKEAEIEEEFRGRKGEIEGLKKYEVITEEKYRELGDKYGDIFQIGTGAEAVLEILKEIDIDKLHQELLKKLQTASGQSRRKLSKQLQLVEAFKISGNRPEWMILTVLPVLPPALRPVVQLDGGRFVISDVNDLYRRIINRNNRLRRLIVLGAPQVIIRNEKRMLQEAVDALVDNGRRGRAVTTGSNHVLKSLSAMLKGKQGRFRQNLLGKRVDYSGRSVIVVGPNLRLHQCGLPRSMALELFKPFVMHKLIDMGYANNLKVARYQVERGSPEVWDLLSEVVKERPVLLNRAPTLHRLSIQAFEPVLIDGDAIQIHPLVCAAFNADFDGDQMAVHLPLSKPAVAEAREFMLSTSNMLLPSCGEPVMVPSLDMVLGCYYLTTVKPGAKGTGKVFGSFEEARLARGLDIIDLGAQITVRDRQLGKVETTAGRILFNDILPPELRSYDRVMDKSALKSLVSDCIALLGEKDTADILDNLKQMGFYYATKSGISIAMDDINEPVGKNKLLKEADEQVSRLEEQFNQGLITEDERYENAVQVWTRAVDGVTEQVSQSLDPFGGVHMMLDSGAKGNIPQMVQMAGMRGLMADPSGRTIDFPIKSSFRDGLSPMEYFISTHGARKGLADTALRTSSSGYLTRRLVDVAQDVVITEEDCGTTEGIWISQEAEGGLLPSFAERIIGYLAASRIVAPGMKKVIVKRNEEIDEQKAREIIKANITKVYVRSPLSCHSRFGICQHCYGRDLARRRLVKTGTAVGVIAAQSIGEPGTQLTLRTFHTGGVVGLDITSGLPRVEELFEARVPKHGAVISEIDGSVEVFPSDEEDVVKVVKSEFYQDEYPFSPQAKLEVKNGQLVDVGAALFYPGASPTEAEGKAPVVKTKPVVATVAGQVIIEDGHFYITREEREEKEYSVPRGVRLLVKSGGEVKAGEQLTEGIINPHNILWVLGREAVEHYLINEVQKVYRSQAVNIHDKHIAVIVRQMLTKVRVVSSGDTELLPEELISRLDYEEVNAKVLAEGGEPAIADAVLLGITRVSLLKDSWLASASFQETDHVLLNAAIKGKTDRLRGLKENVILGKIIPARALEEKQAVAPALAEGNAPALPGNEENPPSKEEPVVHQVAEEGESDR
jgi:DNA-directed RNA polymerase subunit beta'